LIRRILLAGTVGLGIMSAFPAEAVPQFALLTGNRCVNCHVTNQGGGQRSELGRYAMEGVSLLSPESVGLAGLFDALSTEGGGPVEWGFDFRAQTVRSHVSSQTDRRYFPMQAAVYASSAATEWLTLEGTYNFGPKKFDGQERWSASAMLQPDFNWPQLRIGYFQPSVGLRFDDHTMFPRSTAVSSGSQSLIAPNYAEMAAELTYYRYRWLTVTAGIAGARSLAENRVDDFMGRPISLVVDEDRPSLLGRIALWPRAAQGRLNFSLGASYLRNDDFDLLNLFGGIGYQDRLYVQGELAFQEKLALREGRNGSVEAGVQLLDSVIGYARGEVGRTKLYRSTGDSEVTTKHLVIGLQAIVLPGIEIRPEYRLLDTEVFRSGRYAVQFHIFR